VGASLLAIGRKRATFITHCADYLTHSSDNVSLTICISRVNHLLSNLKCLQTWAFNQYRRTIFTPIDEMQLTVIF
jgi:hypothetical protein